MLYVGVLPRLFNDHTFFACVVGAGHPPGQTSPRIPSAAPCREGPSPPPASLESPPVPGQLKGSPPLLNNPHGARMMPWSSSRQEKADANAMGGQGRVVTGRWWHSLRFHCWGGGNTEGRTIPQSCSGQGNGKRQSKGRDGQGLQWGAGALSQDWSGSGRLHSPAPGRTKASTRGEGRARVAMG